MRPRSVLVLVSGCVTLVTLEACICTGAEAYVALMAGQRAKALGGTFNNIPVLHSNQPEIVTGPGILVDTSPGSAIAAETNRPVRNAAFNFDGKFGVHMHHKYYPSDSVKLGGRRRRGLLTLGLIAINPGQQPVTLKFDQGSLKNSFEAPYLPDKLMGVKPLGKRPWNTGPGDATAVQILRKERDRNIPTSIVIPPHSKKVVIKTILPARGIANGLLKGSSNGPFRMAVVAVDDSKNDQSLIAALNRGRLAPGRIYLNRVPEIRRGTVFSRVAGVAVGDRYQANLQHDLQAGPLHVPLTSTRRHHFGTREIQVNRLASRMIDSALNNIGTYGVRFDISLDLKGQGPHQLVLSHPVVSGKKPFTAFRGSIRIEQQGAFEEIHVGLRSGESLALTNLNLRGDQYQPVKVSLVYPADATPGHLLSVVPTTQLAQLHRRQQHQQSVQNSIAKDSNRTIQLPVVPPAANTVQATPANATTAAPASPKRPVPPPPLLPALIPQRIQRF